MHEIELHGQVSPELPLLVVALHEEANHLRRPDLPILACGPGKVNAAAGLAHVLAAGNPREVIGLGTAGALRDGMHGTHEVGTVSQYDFDEKAILDLTGYDYGPPIRLGEGQHLTTGDSFVADSATRERLAQEADLVDMEGYALARAAAAAGVPIRLVKYVSDDSDEAAARSWTESVEASAAMLDAWLEANLGS